MKHKLAVLTVSLGMLVLLTGCLDTGGGSGSLSTGNDIVVAGGPGTNFSNDGYSDTSSNGYVDTSSDIDEEVAHLPEPTTLALLGSGILVYAISRRKKKKKQL